MRLVHPRSVRGGFSLLEVAAAIAIVGVGLTALMVAVGSNTRVNDAGNRLTQGVALAQEIREWTCALPFSDPDPGDGDNPPGPDGSDPQAFVDDLDDLMDVTYSPPRDGQGQPIADLVGWSQTLTLSWRDPDDLTAELSAGSSDYICVTVDVEFKGEPVAQGTWLVTRSAGQ